MVGTSWLYLFRFLWGAVTPVGGLNAYCGLTIPSTWLVCDGSAVSRTSFVQLFKAIGTTFGPGDGTTTFNIPNLAAPYPNVTWIIKA